MFSQVNPIPLNFFTPTGELWITTILLKSTDKLCPWLDKFNLAYYLLIVYANVISYYAGDGMSSYMVFKVSTQVT